MFAVSKNPESTRSRNLPILKLLLPVPREIELRESRVLVDLDAVPVRPTSSPLPTEGYRIDIGDEATTIEADDGAGAFYARATLAQLARATAASDPGHDDDAKSGRVAELPTGTITDWPDFKTRAVMLDVSRTKVPTLPTLFSLIDLLSSWKINHFELYIEHTFEFPGHDDVWRDASPYSREDIEALDAYCAERFVELSANLNTLGHMERWLVHPRYANLGIARGMVMTPWGMMRPASTLDPANPGSLALVRELISTHASCFESPRVHLGLDEPWELPGERHMEWATWAKTLRALPEMEGRTMLAWGDFPAQYPGLLDEIATEPDITICEWGYEAGHPFAERAGRLGESGLDHWLCPGTSSWISILGRTSNAVANCQEAARAGIGSSASGVMVTDWGDFGHLQFPAVSEPGFAAFAAASWCEAANANLDTTKLAPLLDVHGFDDSSARLARGVMDLGDAHLAAECNFLNLATIVLNLYFPQLPVGSGLTTGLDTTRLNNVSSIVESARDAISTARPRRPDGAAVIEEMRAAADLVVLLCDDGVARLKGDGHLSSIPAGHRLSLAKRLADLIEQRRDLWSARNRPGGMEESLAWLEHLKSCYESGVTDPNWSGPFVSCI